MMRSALLLKGVRTLFCGADVSARYADLAGSWHTDSPRSLREEITGKLFKFDDAVKDAPRAFSGENSV